MSLLEARNISVDIGRTRILTEVSASFRSGHLTGLVGPNGAGKSTLVRALCNLLKPAAGEVHLDGAPISSFHRRQLARKLSYLPQGHTMHWPLEVERLVALGRLPHLGPFSDIGPEDQAAIDRAMARTEVSAFRFRVAETLSGGERARVMMARALAVETDILLVDEPVAALDPYHQLHVMELLRSLADEGKLVVCVLHDLALAARFCNAAVLMSQGRVLAEGAPRDVLTDTHLRAAYAIRSLQGQHEAEPFILPWRRLETAPQDPEPHPC